MKNTFLSLLALCLHIVSCADHHGGGAKERESTVYVSPVRPVLFVDDHVSEGFLVPVDDGRIILIFRFDPGMEGSHVGFGGYIAQIYYDPLKDEWSEVETVYNSHQYDDRNIHGGITEEGRIVTFFRRYTPDGRVTEGHYFIYSDDNGNTWSDLKSSDAFFGIQGTGQMFYNPDTGEYCIMQYTRHRNGILFSSDGADWEKGNIVAENSDIELTEIAGAWCGDNRLIALIRDDDRQHGFPLLQVESYDNGETWTEPARTNIPPKQHWGCAPQLIYDGKRDLLIALNSDRYSRPDEQNSLFIYTASPDEVFGNPNGWTLQHELRRPWAMLDFDGDRPLNQNLYGYPSIAPVGEDEYLVVFTERAMMEGTEQADLYYFRMIMK
jgi:hypothetical protein